MGHFGEEQLRGIGDTGTIEGKESANDKSVRKGKKMGALALGLMAFAPAAMAQDKVETSMGAEINRQFEYIDKEDIIKKIAGLRVDKRIEEEGLDIYEHGESCYN